MPSIRYYGTFDMALALCDVAPPEMGSNYDFGNLRKQLFKFFRYCITSHETS